MITQPWKRTSVAATGPSKSVMRLVESGNSQIRHVVVISEVYWEGYRGRNVRRDPCDCIACVLVSVIESIATATGGSLDDDEGGNCSGRPSLKEQSLMTVLGRGERSLVLVLGIGVGVVQLRAVKRDARVAGVHSRHFFLRGRSPRPFPERIPKNRAKPARALARFNSNSLRPLTGKRERICSHSGWIYITQHCLHHHDSYCTACRSYR